MIEVRGFFLPDGEKHLVPLLEGGPEFAGGPTYQLRKLLPMLQYIPDFHHALDIGAHAGLWTRVLARMFTRVTAFEPVQAHIECWHKNLVTTPNAILHEVALGQKAGEVRLHTGPSSSGDTYISTKGEHTAYMVTLDSMLIHEPVDFIKIDCEGFEYFVLLGGEQIIKRNRPTVLVEQKPGHGAKFGIGDQDACTLLAAWGARQVYELSGDYGFKWKNPASLK